MRYNTNSPTSSAAIGNVERQLRQMKKEARHIAALCRQGRFTPDAEAEARKRFLGIFRPLLEDALRGIDPLN